MTPIFLNLNSGLVFFSIKTKVTVTVSQLSVTVSNFSIFENIIFFKTALFHSKALIWRLRFNLIIFTILFPFRF